MTSIWFTKDPEALLDYTIDWSDWMETSDFIVDSTWIAPAGITIDHQVFTENRTTVWISGGTSGESYDLINRITTNDGREDERDLTIYVREIPYLLSRLLPELRLHLGDINSATYRYQDDWLLTALLLSVRSLQRWWNFKYLVDFTSQDVYRNPSTTFIQPSPPVIEDADVRPIILMASIIIKEGSLQDSSWNSVAWRDAEISYSNLEGSRAKQELLRSDWEELKTLISPPNKRLAFPRKGSLPGYINNAYERTTRF